MSESATSATVKPIGYNENPDLLPVPETAKTYSALTFSFMMFSMNTNIPMFLLGPIAAINGLDIWQAIIGAGIGNLAAVIVMGLNSIAGVKHGITFPVQLRASFGFKGVHIMNFLRAFAGMIWFGIEAWGGSNALALIVLYAIGMSAEAATEASFTWLIVFLLLYLGSFVIVLRLGLKGIGKVADYAGPIMLIYFIWLAWWMSTQPQFAANIPKLYVSTAGYASVSFFIYLAVQTNWWATVALNISDLARGAKKWSAVWIGLIVGVVLAQMGGTAIGYTLATLSGLGFNALPQIIIITYAPGALAILLGLLFAFLAPWSTDITANSPPVIDLLMNSLKLSWKNAVLGSAIVAFFVAPWWAASNAPQYVNYFTNWASNYGILLGPIAGPMIAHYYLIAKGKLDLQKLYTYGQGGYWYHGGWSVSGYLAVIVTWIISYALAYMSPNYLLAKLEVGGVSIPFPGGPIWYAAVVLSFVLYYIFAKALKEY